MLSRAARCTLRRDALEGPARIAAQQLTLPWLCPALSRRSIYSPSAPSTPTDSPRRRRKSLSSPTTTTRSLATTAELQPTTASPSPFAGFAQAWGSRTTTPELATLRPWDSSNPLILHDQLPVPTQRTPASLFGVGSDAVELHQNLYACLRVGRTDRAAIILRRLSELYAADAPELLDASNAYLQTLFELTQQDPSPDSLTTIEHWYSVNMVRKDISPNAQTFVTLLRATMAFSVDEKAMEHAVQKYMAIAFEHSKEMVEEINYSPEFTDEEWDMLIRLQPDEFEEPPPVSQVQEMLTNSPTVHKNLIEHGLLATDSIPEVLPVPQKGLGLQTLQDSLDVFYRSDKIAYPENMEGSREEKDRAYAYARQIRMEEDAYDAAVQRWKAEDDNMRAMGVLPQMGSAPIQALMYRWYTALVPVFKAETKKAKALCDDPNPENKRDMLIAYAPWLEQCPPERLAALTISRVVRASLQGKSKANNDAAEAPSKISSLSVAIGNDIREYLNSTNKARHEAFVKKQRREMRLKMLGKLSRLPNEANKRRSVSEMSSFDKIEMPVAMRVGLGAFALELLMQTATITVHAQHPRTGKELSMTQAAFQHNMGYQMGKKVGYIAPHHQLLEKLRKDRVTHIQAVRLPMVVEPKSWASFEDGGYYTIPQKVVRQKNNDPSQVQYAKSAIENGDMKQVLSGLDVLGRVPWQINTSVLKVMTEAWNKGMDVAGLVPEELDIARPEELGPDATPQERAKWGKAMAQYENEKGGYHSQKCFQNFQLETARSFAKEKQIFFPHSVDFRGRAYPIPPTLNHIGADLARGLLVFANGKELGPVGLQWLKIHLANVYGYDKASLKDREQFAIDNLSEVYDSATNPLEGRQWWAKAEDPWQALATCIELKNALESPDPSQYISQLPVHQDGTCNGLQHYAALGGDSAGARQVNLEPSDKPQDIYTGVADLVKEMVAEDAVQGNPHAKFIAGHITRKIVKRTVMTNVYGVTFIGAKDQVHGELKAAFPNFKETPEVRSLGSVALYIAYKIFDALGKIFNGAQEIQHWLGVCGGRITTSLSTDQIERIQQTYEGGNVGFDPKFKKTKMTKTDKKQLTKLLETFKTSIIWTTPLQMPIVQPYRKDSSVKVQSKMQGISINKPDPNGAIDKRKQLQAFPPNFIHSLDATHMLLSALKCNEVGMDFAAVHDSFWTHASDIPNLSVILRDAFVRMHSEDIITRLAEEFKARYAGAMHCATLIADTEVAQKIRLWRREYAKSKGRRVTADDARHGDASLEEIALEAKRGQLLASEVADEVQQGKKMVTPTSIWLDNEDPSALASSGMNLLGDKDKIKVSKKALASAGLPDAASPESDVNPFADGRTPEDQIKTSYYKGNVLKVWVPLTFPPVPKKGDWDIGRLRESEYFFS